MTAINSFNIGRDGAQVTIVDTAVGVVTINGITSFESKPAMVKLKSVGIDGRIKFRNVPDGHDGTFELDRQDASYETYFANAESGYFAGLPPSAIFITHTIQNLDGTVSQFQYSDVALAPEEDGTFKGQEKVTQKFTFQAGRKIQIA
ncbi:hypothetical protein [Burkholderia cenocepacia]|uniref:hypothetical protein n=1 Tax=Burkholderia cenocepacia TaxID=95486 RepID=UPI001CF51A6C|nr:hypothetical protein [Burkholderia cenocepacia]MCA8237752.1 hypothetical protein [Burkholderia cenocepacia]